MVNYLVYDGRRPASAPHSLSLDDFWSCIIRTTTTRLEKVAVLHDVRQAKVSYLDIEAVVKQKTERNHTTAGCEWESLGTVSSTGPRTFQA